MVFLLYSYTADAIFDFMKISNYFPKILQNLAEGHTNVTQHFPKISKDDQRLSKKTQRCFNDTQT